MKLLANIGTAEDAEKAAKVDLEGSGLFRSEFLFLDRDAAPSLEEQTATYTEVLQAFGNRRVVVRTLDAGADKPLSFANLGEEENPALGRRGLRLSQAREDLLDTQLQALAAAHRNVPGSELWVMAPMVATVEEAEWFAERARAAGLKQVGIMVETPAAAIRATHLLEQVDFASIGTNDLSQYTMAADRMEGELVDHGNRRRHPLCSMEVHHAFHLVPAGWRPDAHSATHHRLVIRFRRRCLRASAEVVHDAGGAAPAPCYASAAGDSA